MLTIRTIYFEVSLLFSPKDTLFDSEIAFMKQTAMLADFPNTEKLLIYDICLKIHLRGKQMIEKLYYI